MKDSQSLVVVKKGIFQRIQDFFIKLFKKEKNEVAQAPAIVENTNEESKENFIKDLKISNNDSIKQLVDKIQTGEISLSDKDDAELEKIESDLIKYLQQLQQEVQVKRNEVMKKEKIILNYAKN